MEFEGTGTLFDLDEYADPKRRKPPQSTAEKGLARIQKMEHRELKNLERKLNSGKTLTAAEMERLKEHRERYGLISGATLPEGTVRTMREVANHFGKHVQTIKNWANRGMPRLPDAYELNKIETWAVSKGFINATGQTDETEPQDPGQHNKLFYETELKKVQSQLKALEYDREIGKLIPKEEVDVRDAAKVIEVRRAFKALARKLPPLLIGLEPKEMQAAIDEEVDAICWRFARNEPVVG